MSKSKSDLSVPVAGNDWYKTNGLRYEDHAVYTSGPSLTRQEFAEECDINSLMARYDGHDIGAIMRRDVVPQYADFTQMPTNLLDYMSFMQEAERSFMLLPAVVRRTFDNSAMEFVAFASDPGNLDQMREWGLAPPAEAPQAPPASSQAPAAPAAGAAPQAAPAASTHGST